MNDSATVADPTRLLKRCRIDAETAQRLLSAFGEPAKQLGTQSAGWHGPNDISTLEGLAGEFLWTEDPLQPARIGFAFDAGHVGSQGRYKLGRIIGMSEEGVFHCVPNNPAIGWAFISLDPAGGPPRPFIVNGMFTDAAGRIVIMLLNKTDAQGPVNPPFAVQRIL